MTTAPAPIAPGPDLAAMLRAYNDVTERLKRSHEALGREVCRLREQLQEKTRQLQRRERLAALGQMAAGVAHEIRNPLGGIGLYLSLLERDLQNRPPQLRLVRKMAVGLRNLEGIVGDILAFAGDVEPNRQVVSMAGILEDALLQTAPRARALGVVVNAERDREYPPVFCDPAQVERALINMILNALDAAGKGGHVWVRSGAPSPEADMHRIVVEDDGPGIPPELTERVFNPFFTTKDNGTGLGLAIVYRIAECNGGSVTAGHRSGGGAVFVLSLPLAGECHQADAIGGDI